jgi:sec-independent protein translocase protein TatA
MGLDNPIHIAFLLILLLLVFGAKRLPEMGKSLGSGMRGFKDALGGEEHHSSLAAHQQAGAVAPVAAAPVAAAPVAVAADAQPAPQPVLEKLPA